MTYDLQLTHATSLSLAFQTQHLQLQQLILEIDLDIRYATPIVKATNTLDIWTFQTQHLRLQLLLNKSIAMPNLQLIRDLVGKVRVYGGVLHLRWSQIARVPGIVVGDRLAETRQAQYL